MKELLSFTFALLFIACQNQPFHSRTASPAAEVTPVKLTAVVSEPEVCDTSVATSLEVVKELQDKDAPGFHYREVVMHSKLDLEDGYESLVCVSQVTSSEGFEESEESSLAGQEASVSEDQSLQVSANQVSANAQAWEVLTERWEYKRSTSTCIDYNAQSENPICESPTEDQIAQLIAGN